MGCQPHKRNDWPKGPQSASLSCELSGRLSSVWPGGRGLDILWQKLSWTLNTPVGAQDFFRPEHNVIAVFPYNVNLWWDVNKCTLNGTL